MTRSLVFVVFCSLAMAQSPASSPAASFHSVAAADWRFADPDADMKIGINLQALLNSDVFKKGIAQAEAQNKDSATQVNMVLGMLRTVDRISISARQKAPNDMDVLAEVTGSFDPNFVTALFPSAGKNQVKVVADHTLLIGEGDSFAQALSRMNGSGKPVPGGELEQSDVWIQASAAMIQKQADQQQQTLPIFKDLRGFAVGLTFADAPVVNMVLTSANDAAAGTMLTTLQAMLPLLASSPQSAAITKNLKLSQDGSSLRMRLTIPPEMMAMIQQQALSAAGDGSGVPSQLAPFLGSFGLGPAQAKSGSSALPPSDPAASAPAQGGGSIKIYGLDGGPKEIPIQK